MTTTVAVFTRDLRVRDNPMLAAAVRGADHVVSTYAHAREQALKNALNCEFVVHDDVHTVVPPGALTPAGKDHFAVFGAYHRQWAAHDWRAPASTPKRLSVPEISGSARSTPGPGGETAGRKRMTSWLRTAESYVDIHDALATDGTSRLSPYLHLGCVSALELARRGEKSPEFVRQLAWRDFHHQVLAARPAVTSEDYRPRGDRWLDDDHALAAWRAGETGIPIVDAGMRQLLAEGWMHNRARMIVASFLTKTLYLDWRAGAAHFYTHLLDGDIANNTLNWQWVAGTGTDTRPNRVLNPLRQAERFDPNGDYVRRHIPELSSVDLPHQPWRLTAKARNGYPLPIVDLAEGRARFLAARG